MDIGKKNFANVVKLEQSDVNKSKSNKETIYKIDPTFDEKEFLKGAQNFFEMVIDCFVKGNLNDILKYIDDKLIKNFQVAIDERLHEKEILKIKIVKINSIKIKKVTNFKNFLRLSVLFETEQIKVLKDKNEKVIDGNPKKSILVKDLWTFEKEIGSTDMNWKLVETSDA